MTEVQFLHLDMDAFFAAVEILERPELASRPVIIGGLGARSVVASANYPARAFGVRSAMPVSRALQLCPSLVIIEGNHKKYRDVSRQIMAILHRYTPLVEALSIDEAFLDISGAHKLFGSSQDIANRLRADILAETGLTASIGGAAVKFVAKIASAKAKPDGVLLIPAAETLNFLHPLPVGVLWGVGRKTNEVLHNLALRTVGELAETPYSVLRSKLGEAAAKHLLNLANGIDERRVETDRETKSISQEHTFEYDELNEQTLRRQLLNQSEQVGARARAEGVKGRTVSLKFRTGDFTTLSRSLTLPAASDSGKKIYQVVSELFEKVWTGVGVRLIGVRLEQFDEGDQLLPLWDEEEWSELDQVIDQANLKYGTAGLKPATLLRKDSPQKPRAH
ncbi:MAG: DNA polymerase IV [Microbacteriaceae bacterium]